MLSQTLFLIRRAAPLALLVCASDAWAISVSPSTSLNGSYTVSWNSQPIGCWEEEHPYYPVHCYSLQENGVDISASGWSKAFSGQAAGSYEYQVYYRFYLLGGLWEEYPIDGPVTVQVIAPPPSLETQEYASRHGDVDGDSDIDLYVKRVAGTSWQLPIAELLLRKNAYGTFNVETTVSQATRNIVDTWGISTTQPTLTDVNADGHFDLLIKGLPLVNAAPWDVVVFASNGPGAPPVSARLWDESIKKFVNDTTSYFDDPTYFNNAYQVWCDIYWSTTPGSRYDIDGALYYSNFPIPWVVCQEYTNPAYSYEAVQAAPALKRIFDAGRVETGSNDAQVVDYYLSQLLGVPFMGGGLVSGQSLVPETRREAETLGVMLEWQLYWHFGTPFMAPREHVYTTDMTICNISTPGCTPDAVFEEMLKFPVLGRAVDAPGQPNQCGDQHRSQCQVPVVDGAETMTEIRESPNDDDDTGRVVHQVDHAERELVNETLPGHIFHPGTVTRTVVVYPNGDVRIETTGTGTGNFPALNEIGGPQVFASVDARIWRRFHP